MFVLAIASYRWMRRNASSTASAGSRRGWADRGSAALQGIDVRAFARFPRLREIRVEHATARGQGAAVLTPAAAALAL